MVLSRLPGNPVLPFFALDLIDGKFPVRIQRLIQADVPLQLLISSDELEDLIYDLIDLVFNLVENPVVIPAMG